MDTVTVESMRTETEAFKRQHVVGRIRLREDEGWAVRLVTPLSETLLLVVFETER